MMKIKAADNKDIYGGIFTLFFRYFAPLKCLSELFIHRGKFKSSPKYPGIYFHLKYLKTI